MPIRHNRFSNSLLIEDILQLLRLEQRDVDYGVAEAQLRVALNHIVRLEDHFPAPEHSQILSGLQAIISCLQHSQNQPAITQQSNIRATVVHNGTSTNTKS